MRSLRFLLCSLLCVCICFGLFSVSVYAAADNEQSYFNDNPVEIFVTDESGVVPYNTNIGYTIRPYWRPYGTGTWNTFTDTIVVDYEYSKIEIYFEIYLSSVIKKNSTFDFKLTFNCYDYGTIESSRLALYDSNWNRAVSEFPIVDVNGKSAQCYEIWNNKGDVGIIGITFSITNPFYVEYAVPVPDPEPEPEPTPPEPEYPEPEPDPEPDPEEPSLPTFKINNTYFTYEDGMTWKEWVNSEYNDAGFYLYGMLNDDLKYVQLNNMSVKCNNNNVIGMTKIDSSAVYIIDEASVADEVEYRYNFSVSSLTVTVLEPEEVSGGILGWVKSIWNGITNLPQNIANKIGSFFTELGNKITALGDKIIDGIKGLFIPSEESVTAMKGKFEQLLSDRFGAVYESAMIVDNFANAFFNTAQISTVTEQSGTIHFPLVEIPLAGTSFSFGGWDVDVIPDPFDGIVEMLKILIDVVCTFVFVNALRKKLEALLA